MGKIIKYLFLAIIFFGIIGIVFNNDSDDSAAKARLEKATQSQKNCVDTLGQGVYKTKSLDWKLDNCNVPK
jgi:hypothetical protein